MRTNVATVFASICSLAVLAAAIPAPTQEVQEKRQLLPTGILPTGILPTGILPTGILPTGILPTSILPTGILPTGILPTGILPTGILPSGILPTDSSGSSPSSALPSSPLPDPSSNPGGILPTGILPTGILPSGILPSGILPSGILPSGILPTGILPSGILPSGILPTLPPILPTGGSTDNTCTTGPIQCCQSIEPADSNSGILALIDTLGIQLTDLTTPIGLQCIPVSVLSGCSAIPSCCENSTVSGVIAINCIQL